MENHLFFMKQFDGENHMLRSEAYSLCQPGAYHSFLYPLHPLMQNYMLISETI